MRCAGRRRGGARARASRPFPPASRASRARPGCGGCAAPCAGARRMALVVTTLDAIAWLFNVRGSDVAYNPVVIAYAVVTPGRSGPARRPGQAGRGGGGPSSPHRPDRALRPPSAAPCAVSGAARRRCGSTRRRRASCARATWRGRKPILAPSPIPRIEGAQERGGARRHPRRPPSRRGGHGALPPLAGASVPAGGVTEMSAAAKLDGLRAAGERFRGLSFPDDRGVRRPRGHHPLLGGRGERHSPPPGGALPRGLGGGTTSTARPTLPAPCSSAGGPPTRSATAIPGAQGAHRYSLPRAFPPARPGRGSIPSPAPRSGSRAGTTRTGPGTAWAPSSTCTRGRSRSATARPRCRSSPATSSRTSPATTSPARSASASRTWWRSSRTRPSGRATSCASTP